MARDEVLDQFRRFRRRHLLVRGWDLFLEAAFVMTVTVGAMLLLDRLAFEAGLAAPHLSRPVMLAAAMGGALALAAAGAAAILLMRPIPPAEIAWRLDRAAGGEERFLSALEVAAAGAGGPFQAALCADAARVARGVEPAKVLPRAPVGYRWGIALSLAAAALLLARPPRLYEAPAAGLEVDPVRGPAPLEVRFRDASIGAIHEFLWDFGDGGTARGEEASHVYEKPGRYMARLALRGPGGRSETAVEIEVLSSDRAAADFAAEPVKGRAPLEVRFRNLSRNASRHEWDFGDGGKSGEAEPSHAYDRPGLYTVRLRAANEVSADERVRERYIRVAHEDEPLADFRAVPLAGEAPLEVAFEELCSGVTTEWRWDFGDLFAGSGGFSGERSPIHVFKQPGRYTVRLAVKGPHGEDEEEKVRYIHVRDQGGGKGGGGGGGGRNDSSAARPPYPPPGGAGAQPGRFLGDPSTRPKVTPKIEGVKPHASGGELVEKTSVIRGPGGGAGSGAIEEVPLEKVFSQYQRAAEDSINRERIPPAMRETVLRYFRNIQPK